MPLNSPKPGHGGEKNLMMAAPAAMEKALDSISRGYAFFTLGFPACA